MKKTYLPLLIGITILVGCNPTLPSDEEPTDETASMPAWYYAGGELGTTELNTSNAYEQPTASVDYGHFSEQFKSG